MTTEASVRLRRLLAVLPLFADRGEVSLAELAKRTGVDSDALLDDLSALTDRDDVPGGFIDSVGIELGAESVAIRASHFLRPMRVTVPELCALELGVAMLRSTSMPDEWAAIDRARARIRDLIVKLPLDDAPLPWHSTPPEGSDSPMLATIREAIAAHRNLKIAYRAGDARETSERVISPLGAIPSLRPRTKSFPPTAMRRPSTTPSIPVPAVSATALGVDNFSPRAAASSINADATT